MTNGDALASAILKRIDHEFPDSFLDVAVDRGHSTQKTPKTSANHWVAMCDDANLRTGQSGIVNAHSTEHFGKNIAVSLQEMASAGSVFVPCARQPRMFGKEKVDCAHRFAVELFKFHKKARIIMRAM